MIIILTQCYPPRMGGIENLIENLSNQLSKYHEVLVLADQHEKNKEKAYDHENNSNIIIKRISGIKFLRKNKKINELKKILLSNKIKCIVGDSWKSFELSIDLINSFNIPSICLAHGNEIIIKNSRHALRLISTMNQVSSIICNSNFTLDLVKKIGIKNKHLRCIYPGSENYSNLSEKIISNISGDPVLLTLARLEKRKGHEYILSAVAKLKIIYPNIQYVIAGSGIELKNLKKKVNDLNLSRNVIFVGSVDNYQKNHLFKKTTLMVMPTIDESAKMSIEGFGIAYLEASFFGIPSIASNVGGTNEAVLHNNTGLIISDISELYDSINKLLSNPNQLKRFGKNARIRAENEFKWSLVVKKYLQIISKFDNKKL